MTSASMSYDTPVLVTRTSRPKLNGRLIAGGIGLTVVVVAAVLGPLVAPYDSVGLDTAARLQGPSPSHLFGTDALGRDVLSRLLVGLKPSLVVGIAAIVVAAALGTVLGVLGGYFGRWLDAAIGRALDLLWAWPAVFLAIAVVLVLGPGQSQDVLAIGVAELPVFARVVRAITIANVRSAHVEAARSLGASSWRLMRRHILPFAGPALVVQFAISAPEAVVTGASLNYLGLGTQPPAPSLGSMISSSQEYLGTSPSGALFPILAIAWLVLSLTVLADSLQDMLDPRFGAADAVSASGRRRSHGRRRRGRDAMVVGGHDSGDHVDVSGDDVRLLQVCDLRVAFPGPSGDRVAVNGVSFSVPKGKTVALVGESGSGKSLTALAVLALSPPGTQVTGEVRLDGTNISGYSERRMRNIRERRIGMVFQDPMSALNPVLTVGHQITEVLTRHQGLRGRAARKRAVELLELVEIPDPAHRIGQYPHQLSGGTQQRVMIAIGLAVGPDLLIADEPTTALDVTLQAQIMVLLARLRDELGMALLLISHDLGLVAGAADEVNVMYAGRIVEHADVRTVFRSPAHPYTQGLLQTVTDLASPATVDLTPIPGVPPRLGSEAPGCPFAPRCPLVFDRCRVERPLLQPVHTGQRAACHLVEVTSPVAELAR